MIRIVRPEEIPEPLQTKGIAATELLCQYAESGQKIIFDENIYSNSDVKTALVRMQHGKCAFCEWKINEDGDVEHFRPKTAFQQKRGAPLERPGYYWLAYEWTNLFLACHICNQRKKRNQFPLENANDRARSHHDDILHESPMLINPATENPEELIGWNEEEPHAKQGNRRATETIKALGLKQKTIRDRRFEKLVEIRTIISRTQDIENIGITKHIPELLQISRQLRKEIERKLSDEGEFAAMLRANIALPPPPANLSLENDTL